MALQEYLFWTLYHEVNIGMKHGFYSDQEIPESIAKDKKPIVDYKTNSHGYIA